MVNYLTHDNIIILWLIFGFFLILLDVLQFPGVGILFLGLGALSTSVCMSYINMGHYQIQFFCIASIIWFLLLYKPIKRYLSQSNEEEAVSDIVGSIVVVVGAPIMPNSVGSVKWSGTILNTLLDSGITRTAEIGCQLRVKDVVGNKLICIFLEDL